LSRAGDNVGDAASDVADIAQDTAGDVADSLQEGAESTGKSLRDAGDCLRLITSQYILSWPQSDYM
jgi:hypothetical protein